MSTFTIAFENVSPKDANILAASLTEWLASIDSSTTVRQISPSPDSMDMGTTILLILGSSSVVAIARGLGAWLARYKGSAITISTDQGKIIARNITDKTALKLAEILSARPKKEE